MLSKLYPDDPHNPTYTINLPDNSTYILENRKRRGSIEIEEFQGVYEDASGREISVPREVFGQWLQCLIDYADEIGVEVGYAEQNDDDEDYYDNEEDLRNE